MKAITLWQPWASMVALGLKKVETRSWGPRHRGPLAIHAAKSIPMGARAMAREIARQFDLDLDSLPRGKIVAVCVLDSIKPTDELVNTLSTAELLAGDYTDGRWGWILKDVRKVIPFRVKGGQSLWTFKQAGELELVEEVR